MLNIHGHRHGMYPTFSNLFQHLLIGGLEHFLFFHILGIIIPTDFHIFQRGFSSTTNQIVSGRESTTLQKASTPHIAFQWAPLRRGEQYHFRYPRHQQGQIRDQMSEWSKSRMNFDYIVYYSDSIVYYIHTDWNILDITILCRFGGIWWQAIDSSRFQDRPFPSSRCQSDITPVDRLLRCINAIIQDWWATACWIAMVRSENGCYMGGISIIIGNSIEYSIKSPIFRQSHTDLHWEVREALGDFMKNASRPLVLTRPWNSLGRELRHRKSGSNFCTWGARLGWG